MTRWTVELSIGFAKAMAFAVLLSGCTKVNPAMEFLPSYSKIFQGPRFSPLPTPSNNQWPSISILGLEPNSEVSLYLTKDCADPALGTSFADNSGTAWFSVMVPTEGSHEFRFRHNGECASATLPYTLDITPPVVSGLVNDPTPVASRSFSWSCNETCSYRWSVDNSPLNWPWSGDYTSTNSLTFGDGSGTLYLHVEARDLAGNTAVYHAEFYLDNPQIPTFYQTSPGVMAGSDDTPEYEISSVDSGHTFKIYSDDTCTTEIESHVSDGNPYIFAPTLAADGIYQYSVRVYRPDSHFSSCAFTTYTLDRVAPVLSGLADDPNVTNYKEWNPVCNEPCTYSYVISQNPADSPGTSYFYSGPIGVGTGDGTFYLHIQAIDVAGNTSNIIHVSFEMDTTPPSMPNIAWAAGVVSPSTTDNTPTIDITNLVPVAGDTLEIRTDSCSGPLLHSEAISTTSKQYSVPPQASDTEVYYHVVTRDPYNNYNCNAVSYVFDNTPPPAPTPVDDGIVTGSNMTPPISFAGSGDITGVSYEARIVRVSDGTEIAPWTGVSSGQILMGLSFDSATLYRAEVRAINSLGLISASALGDGFYYDDTPPSAPGTPTLGAVPNELDRTPTITFAASTDAESGIDHYEVRVYRALDNVVVSDWFPLLGGSGSTHVMNEFLENMEEYYLRVRAVNGVGLASAESPASANWTVGCSTTTLSVSGSTAFSTTPGHYCFEVPAGVSSLTVKAWGAGGGGAVSRGGAGGYASATLTVTPGTLLVVTVGSGGERGEHSTGGGRAYGGGGRGNQPTGSYRWGAGGGGFTGLFEGTSPLIIAGAGGGGQGDVTPEQAGVGGGYNGGDDQNPEGGKGGTDSVGGKGGVVPNIFPNPPTACGEDGTYLRGGHAGIANNYWGGGGGGGGGYYGGGGGCRGGSNHSSSGGGGSSYIDTLLSGGTEYTLSGSARTPPNSADPDRTSGGAPGNVGEGGAGIDDGTLTDGGPGRIFIEWTP